MTHERLWEVVVVDDLDPSILERAASFLNEQFPGVIDPGASAAQFCWKLGDANPAGRGFMTVAVHDGEVVGTMTATRKRLSLGGGVVEAAEVGDTYTHPAYRRACRAAVAHLSTDEPTAYLNRSIFGRLVAETSERLRRAGIPFVYGTPNESSRPGYVGRGGYFELEATQIRSFHRPTARLARRALPGPLVDALSSLDGQAARLLAGRAARRVRAVAALSDWIDRLWCDVAEGDRRPQLVRDASWFEHRFLAHPDATYDLFEVEGPSGDLEALVVGRALLRAGGRSTYCIADWLARPGSSLSQAVGAMTSARVRSAATVSAWADASDASALHLRPLGFLPWGVIPVIALDTPLARSLDLGARPLRLSTASSDNV